MKYIENFKFLKAEEMTRKETGRRFIVLNVLDVDNNPCRFFVFDDVVVNKIIGFNLAGLQDVTVSFTLSCGQNGWSVHLDDISA